MKRHLIFIWIFCILGGLAVLPYAYYAGVIPQLEGKIVLFSLLQNMVFFGILLWICSIIIPKTNLNPFRLQKRIFLPAIIAGISLGLALLLLDRFVFQSSVFSGMRPPIWSGILASLYGGFNEEVLLRLFLFTLIYFLLSKISNRPFWVTNILVALLFGLGHVPAAMGIASLTPFEVSRILILNGLAGLTFGWLYYTHGFYAAACAHFITDIVIHGIF